MARTQKEYKMTPERVSIILEALGEGMTQRDASMLSGISEDTLCLWKRNNSEFSEQMAQKIIEYKQKLMVNIKRASEKDWKASAYLLDRRFKKEEGDLVYDFPPLSFDMQAVVDRVIEQL